MVVKADLGVFSMDNCPLLTPASQEERKNPFVLLKPYILQLGEYYTEYCYKRDYLQSKKELPVLCSGVLSILYIFLVMSGTAYHYQYCIICIKRLFTIVSFAVANFNSKKINGKVILI